MNSALSDDSSQTNEQPTLGNSLSGPRAEDGSSVSLTQPHGPVVIAPQENDRTVISQRPVAAPAEFMRSLSLVELARTLEGRSLDHFAVERMIGGGGMGAVFRGRDLRLDREVAIKVIPESRRDPETLRRFRMEAQSAAKLDHPNIARVFDIGEDETWNYIVFEFIDGINLRDLVLMNGPMTVDDAVFTTRQVAEALQHAHDRNVVHRDIKPSNVIITPSGVAKVVDMGLARDTAMDRSTADQTASGVTLGTFDYISPEQARDPRDADVRSDLYSLGCTLFYTLTGQPPFPDGTALQKLLNHGSQPPPDPRQWRDDISDQLAAVLSKLMAKRPADRYQKPIELINDLMLIAQLESLPRSGTAGTILLTPTIAQRSLLELHLPWLVPLCVLIGSAFWLQSAQTFTAPIEVPQPVLQPALRFQPAPPNSAPVAKDSSASDTSPLTKQPQTNNNSTANPRTPEEPISLPALPGTNSFPGNGSIGANEKSPASSAMASNAKPASQPTEPDAADRNNADLVDAGSALSPAERARLGNRGLPLDPGGLVESVGSPLANKSNDPTPIDDSRTGFGATSDNNSGVRPSTAQSAYASDLIVVSQQSTSSSRWAPNLPAAMMQVAMSPEIRTIELRESIELTSPINLPRSGLTLRSAPGAKAEITLSGSDTFGMGWETWFEIDRKSLRCQGLRINCLNDMRQPQAIFAVRPGGKIELDDCWVTMASSRESLLGHCILVKDSSKAAGSGSLPNLAGSSTPSALMPTQSPMPTTLMPSNSTPSVMPMPTPPATPFDANSASTSVSSPSLATPSATSTDEAEPITVSIRNAVVRGAQSLVTMRTACRAEITMENVCSMLEGRVITVRSDDDKGVPPVVRMNCQRSTFATLQGFGAIQAASVTRAPLVLMRTAKLCAFWSPTAVSHLSVDGISDQEVLDKLLLLRGEENAYDVNIENLAQCRLTDGQHIQFRLNDLSGEWFRELGYENNLRWLGSLPPDRPMELQLPSDYQLKDSMYMPGYVSGKE